MLRLKLLHYFHIGDSNRNKCLHFTFQSMWRSIKITKTVFLLVTLLLLLLLVGYNKRFDPESTERKETAFISRSTTVAKVWILLQDFPKMFTLTGRGGELPARYLYHTYWPESERTLHTTDFSCQSVVSTQCQQKCNVPPKSHSKSLTVSYAV